MNLFKMPESLCCDPAVELPIWTTNQSSWTCKQLNSNWLVYIQLGSSTLKDNFFVLMFTTRVLTVAGEDAAADVSKRYGEAEDCAIANGGREAVAMGMAVEVVGAFQKIRDDAQIWVEGGANSQRCP